MLGIANGIDEIGVRVGVGIRIKRLKIEGLREKVKKNCNWRRFIVIIVYEIEKCVMGEMLDVLEFILMG